MTLTGGVVDISRHDEELAAQVAVEEAFSAPPEITDGVIDATYLIRMAGEGHRWAWERLVAKYSRLIWAMTRDFKLSESDASDVVQATWLRLLEHIDRIEHPDRVGSWLATTARHECLRHLAARKRVVLVQDDDDALVDAVSHQPEVDEGLLAAERAQAVREAMLSLPWRWQRLLELLMSDPPVSYVEISDQLGLPIGSIGPTRGRCLERLRELLQAT
jgi:RNA polymerase sigma factor (sigma-70 family)